MSKKRGNWRIGLPWSFALDRFKATTERYWRSVGGLFRSTTGGAQRDDVVVDLSTDFSHPLSTDTPCQQLMEFDDVVKTLNIGDRIRVLCDDGVVVAEKISQTQFELIQYQAMSELVH